MLADGGNGRQSVTADCSVVAGEAVTDGGHGRGLGLGGGSCHNVVVGVGWFIAPLLIAVAELFRFFRLVFRRFGRRPRPAVAGPRL